MSQATPTGISLATPADWVVLKLDEVGRGDWLTEAIDERISEQQALDPHRDQLVARLTDAVRAARKIGTEFAAVLVTSRREEPVIASVSLTHIRGVQDPVAAAAAHAEAVEAEPDVLSTPTPLPVQLPAGTAGRSEHIREHALPGGSALLVLSVQYLIAVPGTDDVAVLNFSSPTLAARAELVARFHAIAESVEFR